MLVMMRLSKRKMIVMNSIVMMITLLMRMDKTLEVTVNNLIFTLGKNRTDES